MLQPTTWSDELGAKGSAELSRRVQSWGQGSSRGSKTTSMFVWPPPGDGLAERATVEWGAFPLRVATCLSRDRALSLLDLPSSSVAGGGRQFQEEYVEWRAGHDDDGIAFVEFTTELREYWQVLAAHRPQRVLELAAEFAGEEHVAASALFGELDPFANETTSEQREAAFSAIALAGGRSDYNNGQRAILCMTQASNSMAALVGLAAASAEARVVADPDGRLRTLTCSECIPLLGQAAQSGRSSDPLVVERLGRLAFEKRQITIDPLNLYISGVQRRRLRLPDGSPLPSSWFTFSRPLSSEDPDLPMRYQRLSIQAPPGASQRLSDVIDVGTEEPLHVGGQLADIIDVALDLRVSAPNVDLPDPHPPTTLLPSTADPSDCVSLRARAGSIEQAK